jgi:hypothetical protein
MWDVGRYVDLFPGADGAPTFEALTVIDDALAFEQIGDGLDTLMIVDLGAPPTGTGSTFMQMRSAPTVSIDAPAP